jgi:hypothetical protein
MAMIGKFVTHDNGVDTYAKVIHILHARLDNVPLLAETFVEISLWPGKPRIDDDIEPFICSSIRRRQL